MQSILWAATGTGFTFLMTTLGAAMVFLFRKQLNASIQRIFLGFAAGVMIAASVWSLLIPAMEEAEASGLPGWLPAVGGFVLGIASCCCWMCCCPTSMWMPGSPRGSTPPGGAPPCWCWP